MKKKAQIFICDQCGEEVSDGGETYIGGSPFNGWYHIERHGGSTDLASLRAQKDWDFCCDGCAIDFLSGKPKRDLHQQREDLEKENAAAKVQLENRPPAWDGDPSSGPCLGSNVVMDALKKAFPSKKKKK
jgi:hypothetical protein